MQKRFENELKRYFENEPDGRRRILRRGFKHHERKKNELQKNLWRKKCKRIQEEKKPIKYTE